MKDLGIFGAGNETAIATLIEFIASTKDDYVLCHAAGSLGKIDSGNKVAASMLSQILETTQDEWGRLYAVQNLMKIDPVNPKTIATLCQICERNPYQYKSILMDAVQNLEQLDSGNNLVIEKLNEVIPILIQFIQIFQQDDDNKNFNQYPTVQLSYESYLLDIADSLTKILQSEHLPQVVVTLKDYLSKQF